MSCHATTKSRLSVDMWWTEFLWMVSVRWCVPESCSVTPRATVQVTGQLVDMPACGLNKSRTGHLAH